ncbi:carcinoembryonic antigen-related cell adhesion molecule 6 isoform X2 [Amia ocellicauda]|uniref:carcinoembryonic antigen-related cell adhesion molecule 6 isoform X2 n=1 Tax=Amia ocellicauda TaxID=2972642 RepID=UPI003463C409
MQRTAALSALLLALTTGCCALQLVLPPGPVNGTVGGSVRLNTAVNPPTPLLLITWRNGTSDASPLVITSAPGGSTYGDGYKGRVSLDRSTGALQITQLTLGDTGTYGVNIITNAGATLTGQVELRVYNPPSNVSVRANQTDPMEFITVALQCIASGLDLQYHWLNGSSEVGTGPQTQLTNDSQTLIITTVQRDDRGPWFCSVSNPVGNTSSLGYNLTVSYGPEQLSLMVHPLLPPSLLEGTYPAGSDLTLSCLAQSSPPALYRWAVNGTMTDHMGPELRLPRVQAPQSGNYTCWASNSRTGRTEAVSTELTVLELITSVTVLPAGGEVPMVGGNLTLQCQADAPVESRQWSRVNQPLPLNASLSKDNSTLSLALLSPSDTGDYECRATNPVSTGTGTYGLTFDRETQSGSLSGGAIAGIVIGCLVGLALVGGAVYFLLRIEGSSRSPPTGTGEHNSQSAMYENSIALSPALTYENLPAPHTGPGKTAVQCHPEEADATYTGLQFQDCSTYSTLDRH